MSPKLPAPAPVSNRRRQRLKRLCIGLAVLLLSLPIFWACLGFFTDPLAKTGPWDWSVRVTDRHGRLLKEFLPPKTVRREDLPLAEFSPDLLAAVLAAEDKRFYQHHGVDPLAMIRAAWLNVSRMKIVSGGSTITMQLARLNRGLAPGPRTISRKLREIWWALLIERHNEKEDILVEYLNRAPCGNLTEGFPAAARLYLNKSVKNLSPAESAFLAGLPASPGILNPYKDPRPALERRSIILTRMAAQGFLSPEELKRALSEPLALTNVRPPFAAPHFVSYIRHHYFHTEPPAELRTTLDLTIQTQVEEIVAKAVEHYKNQGLDQAAVVVMTLPEREILAWVGSSDFFSEKSGQNDGVTALRQPGSALKPFIYAAAFDQGLITPATLLDDQASDYQVGLGTFSPRNYSGGYHGRVPARVALASSLNLPAVKLIERTGVGRILTQFRQVGLVALDRDADYYGLGLALGGGEVDLLSLTSAYAALADGGQWLKIAVLSDEEPEPGHLVISPGAAFLVTDILADPQARATGFGRYGPLETPYPAAVKTGTSKNFRDNWCLGYTTGFAVGVWAGNFEATPMNRVSGVTGAGMIWREVSDFLAARIEPESFRPATGVLTRQVCPESGLLAGPECPNSQREYFLAAWDSAASVCRHSELTEDAFGLSAPVVGLDRTFGLIRPLSRELYAWDPALPGKFQNIKAWAQSVPEVDELVWLLNDQELARQKVSGYARSPQLVPLSRGRLVLEVRGLKDGRVLERSRVSVDVK